MSQTEHITTAAEFAEIRRQYERGYMTETEYNREMDWRIAPLVRKES